MRFTPEDIRAEHEAAKASMTPAHTRAVAREAMAWRMGAHSLATPAMRLQAVFDLEASARNEALERLAPGYR